MRADPAFHPLRFVAFSPSDSPNTRVPFSFPRAFRCRRCFARSTHALVRRFMWFAARGLDCAMVPHPQSPATNSETLQRPEPDWPRLQPAQLHPRLVPTARHSMYPYSQAIPLAARTTGALPLADVPRVFLLSDKLAIPSASSSHGLTSEFWGPLAFVSLVLFGWSRRKLGQVLDDGRLEFCSSSFPSKAARLA